MIGSARIQDGLYYFDEKGFQNKQIQSFVGNVSSFSVYEKIMLWHHRLGHPSFFYLKHLFPGLFRKVDCNLLHCESCALSKSHWMSYEIQDYFPSSPFYMIHSHVWGLSKIYTLNGKRWFATFIDDHTRLCWIYLMKSKSDVAQNFKDFYTFTETQFQVEISIFKTNNGTKYFNTCLGNFLKEKGIHHISPYRDTPQQNSIAERKHQHLLEVARSPHVFYAYAKISLG